MLSGKKRSPEQGKMDPSQQIPTMVTFPILCISWYISKFLTAFLAGGFRRWIQFLQSERDSTAKPVQEAGHWQVQRYQEVQLHNF